MEIRELTRDEIGLIWTIDRAELVESLYSIERGKLALHEERYDMRGWPPGTPERSGPLLLDCLDHGGTCWGAFEGESLVGACVLESRFIGADRDQLELKFLHVSRSQRNTGVGRTLFERAVAKARELGASRLYISATPSQNTIDFYLRRGCRLAEEVDPELYALEPEDIHLELLLR